jgi:hypothetical protein
MDRGIASVEFFAESMDFQTILPWLSDLPAVSESPAA